jgi:hypothetical protein
MVFSPIRWALLHRFPTAILHRMVAIDLHIATGHPVCSLGWPFFARLRG